MGKYDGILICSDLDGTLCNSNKEFSKENLDAINYFTKNGGRFSLSTGRNWQYAKGLEEKGVFCNAPVITMNGAMIYDIQKNKVLYHNPMDIEKISSIREFAEEQRIYCDEIVYHSKDIVQSLEEIEDNMLYKVVFACKNLDVSKIVRKNVESKYSNDFSIINGWDVGVEILHKNSSKGECIKKMREFADRPIDKIICVGDYENDISMLQSADVGYAVANAMPEVKAAASKVTVSNDEHALAAIISEL